MIYRVLFLSILSCFILSLTFAQQTQNNPGIEFHIRNNIENNNPDRNKEVRGRELYSSEVMPKFYQQRDFLQAWSYNGELLQLAYDMRQEIRNTKYHGLNPDDYHLDAIQFLFEKNESSTEVQEVDLASLDVLLTDAYIMISSHLYLGKVNPDNLEAEWGIQRSAPELRIDLRLQKALTEENISGSLEELYPTITVYKKMTEGLKELYDYQEKFENHPIADWKRLRDGKTITESESHKQIPEIRNRLLFYGDLEPYVYENETYDSIMVTGIKKLQQRHGLATDGIIGPRTYKALDQTPEDLIKTASVNLERMRWLPANLKEQELILVNTANFQLDYIKNRDTLLSSKVIIGKKYHSTPQFSAMMSYLVFSPTWTIPQSITRNEIIPAAKKDPDYFQKRKMKVLTYSGQTVDPKTIDWSSINSKNFPYFVRQMPGDHNALGLVKFMFPNKYSVYIHDTPSRGLFEREDRALSHGCIRVAKPVELAKLLLKTHPEWTESKIIEAMHQEEEESVSLGREIPVVILYITYWADSKGNISFREDLYNRDSEVYNALRESRGFRSGI